jgi:diguanylate cyclase (GGDEF)-like protein
MPGVAAAEAIVLTAVAAALLVTTLRARRVRARGQTLERIAAFAAHVDGAGPAAVLSLIERMLPAAHTLLVLLDDEGATTYVPGDTAGHDVDEQLTAVARAVWTSGVPSVGDGLTVSLAATHGWHDCVVVPLPPEAGVPGVLLLADRTAPAGDDLRVLATAVARLATAIATGRMLRQLTYDTRHDGLTGLANRAAFHAELAGCDPARPVALLLLDLDRFKEVNDTLGHHHGDLLIQVVADRLQAAAPPEAVVARLGGDEFAVLLPEVTAAGARQVAYEMSRTIAKPCRIDGVLLDVQSSIGVAACPDHAASPPELLRRADTAMYDAKQAGLPVALYDRRGDAPSLRRLALASRLRTAASDGHLVLEYQPQVGMGSGEVVGVEALMRWHHPEFGVISPGEFIPLAEQSGAIGVMSHWALTQAVAQAAQWRDEGVTLEVSVNLSMRNLGDGSVADHLGALLDRHRLDPRLLTLEITESQIMGDPERTTRTLRTLADLGVSLSIDDFGTGYSSLAYLRQLPVHEIKIDRSFMTGLATGEQQAAIVRAVTDLAQSLSMRVVAEGVEDIPTLHRLDALGCDRVQGFLFSKSLAAADIAPWISGQFPYLPHTGSATRLTLVPPQRTADDGSAYLLPRTAGHGRAAAPTGRRDDIPAMVAANPDFPPPRQGPGVPSQFLVREG